MTVSGTSNYCNDADVTIFSDNIDVVFHVPEDITLLYMDWGMKYDSDKLKLTGFSTIPREPKDCVSINLDPGDGYEIKGSYTGGASHPCNLKTEDKFFNSVFSKKTGGSANVQLDIINLIVQIDGKSVVLIKDGVDQRYTVSGTITSFLDEAGQVEIQLVQNSTMTMIADEFVTGNTVSYSIPNIPDGTYTISVLKKNHVTKSGKLTVSGDTTKDVKIHPLGDINGDGTVNNFDFGRVNSHARGKSTLKGYEFSCGDVNGDGNINNFDAGRVNSHARNKSSLWT